MEEPSGEEEPWSQAHLLPFKLMKTPRAWPPLARREEGGYVIDLLTTQCRGLPAHRLVLLLVLQLAVKDRATELRFEQSRFFNGEKGPGAAEVGFSLSYRVDGQ